MWTNGPKMWLDRGPAGKWSREKETTTDEAPSQLAARTIRCKMQVRLSDGFYLSAKYHSKRRSTVEVVTPRTVDQTSNNHRRRLNSWQDKIVSNGKTCGDRHRHRLLVSKQQYAWTICIAVCICWSVTYRPTSNTT